MSSAVLPHADLACTKQELKTKILLNDQIPQIMGERKGKLRFQPPLISVVFGNDVPPNLSISIFAMNRSGDMHIWFADILGNRMGVA